MPRAPRKPCPTPGCPNLVPNGQRRCPTHTKQHETQRGSRQQRGYNTTHDKLRKQWAPIVATGTAKCTRCNEPIHTGEPWDLGHNDTDRTKYNGPEHTKCNRSAGGRKAHRANRETPPPF